MTLTFVTEHPAREKQPLVNLPQVKITSHIQHSAHSFSHILSSFLYRHRPTAPLARCDGTVTQKDTIVLHRIPFHSCLVIKKGLHG